MDKQAKEKEPKTPPATTTTTTTQVCLSSSELVIDEFEGSLTRIWMIVNFLFFYCSSSFFFFRSSLRLLALVQLILTGRAFRFYSE